ncbi:MAG: PDZ domain-containing protein, partial [Ekhidna sp.]
RTPSWSPDGKKIAYWSDESGEYQLRIYNTETDRAETVTNYTSGFRYALFWSPDSKKVAFVNQAMEFNYFDLSSRQTIKMDQGSYLFHGGLGNYTFSWSSDSKWIAYTKENANRNNSIHVFNTQAKTSHRLTGEYYNDFSPTFDPDNKYLFFLTNRNIRPVYSDLDNTFIYPNSTMLAAVPLTASTDSPLKPKNDEVEMKKEESGDDDKKKGKKKDDEEKKENEAVAIDLVGFEDRMVLLPVDAGNYGSLEGVSGKVVFTQFPNAGSNDNNSALKYYDIEEREVKTIVNDMNGFEISADGKKAAVSKNGKIAVIDISENQKMDESIDQSNVKVTVNPMQEWKQIFVDAWRLQRDYFYDENMHGVDWNSIRTQYGKLIDQCVTRWDVNFVLGEMIGELNASHTYRGGGDLESSSNVNVGYLGVDWEKVNGAYRIARIVRGASWDAETESPLDAPGVNAGVNDYVLAVNGVPMDASREPHAAFQGLGNQTVELTVNSSPSMTG